MSNELDLCEYRGSEIDDCLDAVAGLRMTVFRDWPYLYDGDVEYEKRYLAAYAKSPHAFALVVFDGDRPVGATTAMPLADEDPALQQPFIDNGIDIAGIFYNAESILLPGYRGRGLYRRFFEAREAHARSSGDYDRITFCGVQRPDDHPMRPADHRPLDPVWRRFGYEPRPDLIAYFPWRDIGDEEQTDKPLMFWWKLLT
jgi:GNAT superfamily N-acetyltransferase